GHHHPPQAGADKVSTQVPVPAAKASRLDELKPSLVVNLHPTFFTLDNNISHPYSAASREFLRAIDSQRLSVDLLDLLQDIPCHWYGGCLVVELRHYRHLSAAAQSASHASTPNPAPSAPPLSVSIANTHHAVNLVLHYYNQPQSQQPQHSQQ